MPCRLDDDGCALLSIFCSILNEQYLRHSGKEFEGCSDRSDYRTFIKCCTQTTVSCDNISLLLFLQVDHYRVARSGKNLVVR